MIRRGLVQTAIDLAAQGRFDVAEEALEYAGFTTHEAGALVGLYIESRYRYR